MNESREQFKERHQKMIESLAWGQGFTVGVIFGAAVVFISMLMK